MKFDERIWLRHSLNYELFYEFICFQAVEGELINFWLCNIVVCKLKTKLEYVIFFGNTFVNFIFQLQ